MYDMPCLIWERFTINTIQYTILFNSIRCFVSYLSLTPSFSLSSSIRGDISTTVDYISRLIELQDFIDNNIDTAWLDGIIQQNVEGIGGLVKSKSSSSSSSSSSPGGGDGDSGNDGSNNQMMRRSSLSVSDLTHEAAHLYVVLGATIVAYDHCVEDETQFLELMKKGQLPPRSLLQMSHTKELILSGIKYQLVCTRKGQSSFKIQLLSSDASYVMSNVRPLSDGGYLIEIGGQSHNAYVTNKGDAATGMKLNVSGSNIVFSPDYDPTSLRTDVAGKLVKRLVQDGTRVKKGEPYAEIEVMKMFMPLKVEEAGIVEWKMNEGAALSPGDLVATLVLDNPENVATTTIFQGQLQVQGWVTDNIRGILRRKESAATASSKAYAKRPHLVLRGALAELHSCMSGYSVLEKMEVDKVMDHDITMAVTDSLLPMLEIDEQLSVLCGRIPLGVFTSITTLLSDFQQEVDSSSGAQQQNIVRYVSFCCC